MTTRYTRPATLPATTTKARTAHGNLYVVITTDVVLAGISLQGAVT